jgi:hypothetical protein
VSKALREAIADWLMLLGAAALLVSLFLAWSHQSPPDLVALRGVPRDPTAWQVYSVADVLLALVTATLVFVAFLGTRIARLVAIVPVGIAMAFVVRASSVPPTNGVALALLTNHPRGGTGETVALVGLGVALAGLALSFTAD